MCKRMLPGTVLEVNEHREAGGGWCFVRCRAACWLIETGPWSCCARTGSESSVFGLCGAPALNTAPPHCVLEAHPAACCPVRLHACPAPLHSNTVREPVGRGPGTGAAAPALGSGLICSGDGTVGSQPLTANPDHFSVFFTWLLTKSNKGWLFSSLPG